MRLNDRGEMDDVITLSSDSSDNEEDYDDSDVEIIGSYSNVMTKVDDPLTEVRVDVGAVNVPRLYIDLAHPRWTLPELKVCKRQNSTALTLVDLTETNEANWTKQETDSLPLEDTKLKKESTNENQTSNEQDFNLQKCSLRDPTVFALQQDCGDLKPKQRRLDSQTQQHKQTDKARHCTAIIKLKRLPFLETHVELKTSRCSVLNKDHTEMPLHLSQLNDNNEAPVCISNAYSACSDKGGSVATSNEYSTREDKRDDFCSSTLIPSPTSPNSSQDKAQGSLQREGICSKQEQLQSEKAESKQRYLSDHSFPHSPTTLGSLTHHTSPIFHNLTSQVDLTPASERTLAEKTCESEKVNADEASNSSEFLRCSVPSEPPLSTEDMDDGSSYREDLGSDSPVSFHWQEGSDGDEVNKENRFDMDFRAASREDRQFVCPVTLKKIMSGSTHALLHEEDESFGTPEVLCRQSLSLVYSTIEESYPEGTLQLLSDLLQPGYYPPRDITSHLLCDILLDTQGPYHLCVQAFNLLMRTQRHHMADKTTIPWDWELLTSVTSNQDHKKRHRCEVVRMLLDYVVQTLEDDFQAKRSISDLHNSIAKATLSCDQQFPRVREVIKWLFSAIMKSTEQGESREAARERDEQIRMVSIFQRMLSLALEVDRSPALNSAKLSQELFHMLISNIPLRAHRMLLLESLQSKLLRCKLLEHLLDYTCPQKISLPMSLSLLLHFMKYCTLTPDPSDGTERWRRWEELVHLLWMLLLSYNKAMKGYLCNSVSEQRGNLVYKPDDMVSKPAIREAVEAFLSRSQADLGQALPLHVEESLTYLQDHLLDVCQC